MALATLTPGTIFARDFLVHTLVAEGGMGAVYRAEQRSTGNAVALKIMLPELLVEPGSREKFEHEARVSGRIRSSHVVKVLAAGIDDATQTPWLAMEFLEGESLAAFAKARGPLAPEVVLAVLQQVGHALSAAHVAGVVHCDLKPENIFIADSQTLGVPFDVKVLDFGIARIVKEGRQSATVTTAVGSPHWLAPEQGAKGKTVSPATDVWSFGLIAFWMLTGRFYWMNANVADDAFNVYSLLGEIAGKDAIVPASERLQALGGKRTLLPTSFDAWFARCVSRDVTARFQTVQEAVGSVVNALRTGGVAETQEALPSIPRGFTQPMTKAVPPSTAPGDAATVGTKLANRSDLPTLTAAKEAIGHRPVPSSSRLSAGDVARSDRVAVGDPSVRRPALTAAMLTALTVLFLVELLARPPGAPGFSPDITTLISLGGLVRDLVIDGGEWWRLLTAACLHGDFLQLLMNGVSLFIAGVVLERRLGRAWLGALFVLGALGGSLMGLAINPDNLVSVGASGASMGLLAPALMVAMRLPDGQGRAEVWGMMAGVLIIVGLRLVVASGARVDYAVHLGGALAGALVGAVLWTTWDVGSPTPPGRGLALGITMAGMIGLAWGAWGVTQTHDVATALAPQAEIARVATGDVPPATLDALVRRWPRDPRGRFIRAAARINADDASGAEEDLRAALAEERVLRTGFRDRRLEIEVRSLLAQVLMQRGRGDEARSVVAPVCREGAGGTVPLGLAQLGLCE